ncbi:sugar phosphate isomerase/epimerase [Candidatus Bathyarchaeota archaeon]|nr:sugar phosphate isomerase/epimerase [Candidatus Bathyarchaeota archaeon]MBS7617422.1 sugar phosphate isomerase/epimerase [Candidatus Bathyarchaeota archaeon]
MNIVVFAKMFQKLPLPEFASIMADIGFEGVDLTVRPGGYIAPEEVEEKLPEAIDIVKSKGLSIPIITTSIVDANEPYAEETFKTASECGVKYLKLGYWLYEGFGKLKAQIENIRKSLREIEKLSRKYCINAAIHTHSGMFLTAEPAVVLEILRDFNPDFVGAYIDPGHMVVEGGLAGWLMGMDMLNNRIRMVAVKDFAWIKRGNSWKAEVVPLGEGLVPWRKVFEILKRIDFKGPVSIHCEYEEISLREIIEQARKDLNYVRNILSSV